MSRIINLVAAWEGLGLLVSLILGVGVAGCVVAAWVLHFTRQGELFFATATLVPSVLIGILAVLRIPAALVLVLGFAAVAAVALPSGATDLLLP
jgi:peptidoglycan/LPS O-acetylase OafA/YrhL